MFEDALQVVNGGSMLLQGLSWVTGGGALAVIAAGAIPRVLDRMLPPASVDELWTFLPFERVAADRKTVVCGKRHLRVIELEGAEITLASDGRHRQLFEQRCQYINELAESGLERVKFLTLKQRIGLERTLRPRVAVVREMDERWEANFVAPTRLAHYLILVAKAKTAEEMRALLDQAELSALSALAEYGPKVMEEPEAVDPDAYEREEDKPRGPLKPFAQVLSPISLPNPMGRRCVGRLSALMATDDVDFSDVARGGLIRFGHGTERRHAAVVGWRDCGDKTSEGVMRELSALPCEMMIYHVVEPIPTAPALIALQKDSLAAPTAHLSLSAKAEYEAVIKKVEGLTSGEARSTVCQYAMHVVPICRSEAELREMVKEVTKILRMTTGTAVTMGVMAQPSLLSMVDDEYAYPRRYRFLSENAAANLYPQRSVRGNVRSDWCDEPVAWLRTLNGDPYPFQFHVSDAKEAVGHVCVVGTTGSGKTTLMTFLAAMAGRVPRLRTYLFDRLYGMKVFTQCAGGRYLDFDQRDGEPLFNPLHMPDTGPTRAFLLRWLQEITGQTDAVSRREFSQMIELVYGMKIPMRTRALKHLAQPSFSSTGQARLALEPWVDDAQYGRMFNAESEALNLESSRLTAFNMTAVLNDDKLAPAVVSYLVHRVQSLSMETRDPSLIVLDECASLMRNKLFAEDFLSTGLREGRKLRQAFALCFQTPSSLMETGQHQVILDQCHTKIFFRIGTDSENAVEQYKPFGLNQAEIDFLTRRTFKNYPYAVLIARSDGTSAMVDTDNRSLGPYANMFKSGTESVGRLDDLLRSLPRDQAIRSYLGV